MVLDDALASVDNKTASLIIDEMRGHKNKTIIMISHQLSVGYMWQVLVMDKGVIIQEGKHQDLIKVNGLYKKLVGKRISYEWNKKLKLILFIMIYF